VSDSRIRVRANRSTGELEVEGPDLKVAEWWDKLWPELAVPASAASQRTMGQRMPHQGASAEQTPAVFGEFFSEFRSDVTDVDKILIAASFAQAQDAERVFTTKLANQFLLDQNVKVTNASENVRRLTQTKRVFVVSDGKFRVSASGAEYLKTLKESQ
jgi:hypothetical protein